MDISIVIPTYNKCNELLKPCLESLFKHTSEEVEVIVVANGCTDNTWDYLQEINVKNFSYLWSNEPLGYTKAVNWGIEVSKGDYVVLLNNDTILLPQDKGEWLRILKKPFLEDATVGITGPMMTPSTSAGNRNFLIFFCVMIKRELFKAQGLLDEVFSPGYGEDTDFCLRAEAAGWKQVQVPTVSTDYYAYNRMTGNFPIYHAGNQTFKDHPDEALIHRNNDILAKRYGSTDGMSSERAMDKVINLGDASILDNVEVPVDISKAQKCDGYMADEELEWLAKQAQKSKTIIEVGSWHGKSSRAMADNTEGLLICVDHWRGSETERNNNHQSAMWEDGDHAYLEFLDNMRDLTNAVPLRLSSKNAAVHLHKCGVKADMIFIDAGHTYEEVKEDILAWLPLLKEGGTICGHDMFHVNNVWPGVGQAVYEIFGNQVQQAPNTSIWVVNTPKITRRPPAVFDCFPFNNELDILEERLSTLYDVVDRFVIVESRETHSGNPKDLNFHNNLQRFERFLNKITYLVIEKFPDFQGSVTDKSWARERFQRDYIMNGLNACQPDDIIIISDCDEIPARHIPNMVREYEGVVALEMDLYYYNRSVKAKDNWYEAKATRYANLKKLGPCGLRYAVPTTTLYKAGEHLSYFGGVDSVIAKIENTAHQEYNTPEMKDRARIAHAIAEGTDVFGRPNIKFQKI